MLMTFGFFMLAIGIVGGAATFLVLLRNMLAGNQSFDDMFRNHISGMGFAVVFGVITLLGVISIVWHVLSQLLAG